MASDVPKELLQAAEQTVKTIKDPPRAGQDVTHNGTPYTTIREGLAYILVPHGMPTSTDPKEPKEGAEKQSVFYNPIQQFNRDLSVLSIKAFGEDLLAAKKLKAERQKNNASHREKQQQKRNTKRGLQESEDVQQRGNGVDAESVNTRKRRRGEDGETNNGLTTSDPKTSVDLQIASIEAPEALEGGVALPGTDLWPELQKPTNESISITGQIVSRENKPNSGGTVEKAGEAQGTSTNSKPSSSARKPEFKILDALSATGLRALRYAQEIPFATSVIANDMSRKATQSIALNIKHNRLEDKITANTGNAIAHMYSFVGIKGYDVIDLDPYGTAAPFLDAAVQALNDGGLLCVTCTDAGVFASVGYPEKTYSQYGGLPIKGPHSHEGGLRLILHAVASSAARYGVAIEPLLSLSIDYYARVFVRVRKSPAEVKFLAGKTMLVYNCDAGCGAWQTQFIARNQAREGKDGTMFYKHSMAQAPTAAPLCEHCGRKTHLSGPMYGGPLHNPAFIEKILNYLPDIDRETYLTTDRIEGMLQTAYEETLINDKPKRNNANGKDKAIAQASEAFIPQTDPVEIDHHPFFLTPSALSKVIHCQAPSDSMIRGALRSAGFRVSRSHCKPGTIKTDASWADIWYVMREWARQKAPIKEGAISEGTAGWTIMQKALFNEEDNDSDYAAVEGGVKVAEGSSSETGGRGGTAAATDAANGADQGDGTTPTTARDRKYKVVFDETLGKEKDAKKLVRYQLNPRKDWGPLRRAR